MKLTLKQKRSIVDRFYAGSPIIDLALDLWQAGFRETGHWPRELVEETLRWSHKSKTERRRVWRKLTRAGGRK